jgi:type I restriction enzyme, S subunit
MGLPLIKLGDVLVQNTDYISTPEFRTYPKLSVKLYGKGVVLDAPVDGASLKMKRHQLARSGQVILSEIWGKKGALGLVPPAGDGALCTSHFFLFDPITADVEPGWLQLIFRANYLQPQLESDARGTTDYAAVRPKTFLNCVIPLPPLDEQRRIVHRIEELATKIGEVHDLRAQSSLGLDLLMTAAITRALDGSWQRVQLQEAVNSDRPITYGIVQAGEHVEGGIPYIRVSDMAKPNLTLQGMLRTSPDIAARYERSKVQTGDIVFAIRATVGKMRFVPPELDGANLTQGTARIAPGPGIIGRFLFWALQSGPVLEAIDASSKGSTFREITLGRLRTLEIPLPPVEDQHRIVAFLDEMHDRVSDLRNMQTASTTELDVLIPSILARAFKGEL